MPVPVSAPAVKPTATAKKPLSLKALFSRKPVVTPPLPPPQKADAVTVKKSPPAKPKAIREKPVPVIPRNTGEFINISFPEPRSRKPSASTASSARG